MRAVHISRPGGPETLILREIPDPVAGPEEVIVRVRATALNRADLLQRRGRYPAPPGTIADVPGLEFAGEVESCGTRVQLLQRGERVMGILGGGGYAERVAVHERLCMRVAPALSWESAAALPEAFLTAYDALFRSARLAAGETLLVHAAASGVGSAAVQLALLGGSRVIGLSRTADKRRRLEQLGVQQVLDPQAPGLADAIRQFTGGNGVDVVLDLVGASAWALNAEVLAERGRAVVIGLLGGARCEIDLALLMRRRLTLIGSVLRSRSQGEKIALIQEFAVQVLPHVAAGRLSPLVHCTLDLARAGDAHALMERNENFGKIVLRV